MRFFWNSSRCSLKQFYSEAIENFTLTVYGDWVKEEMCLHADINLAQSLVEIHLTIKYLLLFQPIWIGWRFLDTVEFVDC